ncbi:4-(cytidine 5'-diphospho)-2-C-methyl-D-erythritol kinase [Aliigemmobacter aestuarii]|uniref:4-diphosphocytidyl-2-C-methyl-D-erythritol kinase n=1 Tax=Aliigemmobacter aestuarii TaxID=1445661 RepID=A0A4S3MP96_9RHOB|nr:4-(cytidine 5'-diphospho)-2-C-methyl-D-erythritol kinase [Gemmobacter aestuarii]THD83555.1 4-(cytidine 5'-diphospho)-2-C-methyl-D-erythritol kinase [Gemmobacter aestuarii]
MATEFAYAKVNLALHVTGQRADGYHLLDSLVAFAGIGDSLRADPADRLTLAVDGPFGAEVPAGDDNLVMRAARLCLGDRGAALRLTKRLPPASGIGGGSADAAATIRALMRMMLEQGKPPAPINADQGAAILALGADVPVCLASHPARMRGIGEQLDWLTLPPCFIVLANPRVEVPTPAVFRALAVKENPPLPDALPGWTTARELADWLALQRNDLEPPARQVAPVIGDVVAALSGLPGALMARMSGSGATCFALFADEDEARDGAEALQSAHPGWWVAAAPVYPGRADMDQLIRATT